MLVIAAEHVIVLVGAAVVPILVTIISNLSLVPQRESEAFSVKPLNTGVSISFDIITVQP